jgi:phosphoglycerol transferase MdoB-like AlkP superfamily enzyme
VEGMGTRINLKLFPAHTYPFISLLQGETLSIVWDFKEQGFAAVAVHPNTASFWNPNYAYPFLGFDESHDIRAFKNKEKVGFYVSDSGKNHSSSARTFLAT